MQAIFPGNVEQTQTRLLQEFRDGEYLVSRSPEKLRVDIPKYQGRSHGPFGLGPKWEEKVVVDISFTPCESGTLVSVDPKVYERQNQNFKWIEVDDSERADRLIRPVLYKIQKASY